MAEFVIKLADERGRVQEQVQTASTPKNCGCGLLMRDTTCSR